MRFCILLTLLFITVFTCYGQDLLFTAYNGPTTFAEKEQIDFTTTIKNAGIVPIAGRILTHAYLSTDSIISYGDHGYVYGYGQNLEADESVQLSMKGSFNAPPGTYYLLLEIDYYEEVQETNEDNNILVIPNVVVTTANVDWRFNTFSVEPVVHTAEKFFPLYQIANVGTTNMGAVIYNYFYLSVDQSLDDSDVSLGQIRHFTDEGTLDVFSNTFDYWFLVMPNVSPGHYYLIGVVDGDGSFAETDETNNTAISEQIEIRAGNPDLFISDVYGVDYDDGFLSGSLEVSNLGSTGAGYYTIQAFLSQDNFLSYDDPMFDLTGMSDGYSAPGYNPSNSFFASSSDDIPPGSYYLIIQVNGDNAIYEPNTTNNIYISPEPVIFIGTPPSISMFGATFLDDYDDTDLSITVGFSLLNSGGEENRVHSFQAQLSDLNGNLVMSQNFHHSVNLMEAQSASYVTPINLGSTLTAGIYQLKISGLSSSYTSAPITLDLLISPHENTLSGVVKGEDGTPINQGKLFLYRKHENGTVSFINKTVYEASNDFSFPMDAQPHTLFYIPDPIAYPQYVPTIYGKTVTLSDDNFLSITDDLTVDMEVLKIVPISTGSMSITGNIHNGSSGANAANRIASLTQELVEGFPIVLLSAGGDPIAVTVTDADGNYQFNNLPNETYSLVVALELDKPVMQQPVEVDLSANSAVINLSMSDQAVEPELLYQQEIQFVPFGEVVYGEQSITALVSASSGLPVLLESSNPEVAIIENGEIVLMSAGITTITAIQPGNSRFIEATPVTRELVIDKAQQSLIVTKGENFAFGSSEFYEVTGVASSGLPVSIESSNPGVARVNGLQVEVVGAGVATLSVSQSGNQNYHAAASVTWQLTIHKASQTISFGVIPTKTYGDADFAITAESTSGLPVNFISSDEAIAVVENGMVHINGAGMVTITAQQAGDQNFIAALPRTRTLNITKRALQLAVEDVPEKTYGDGPFSLTLESTSGFVPNIQSLHPEIISVSGGQLLIARAGRADIVVSLAGDKNHHAISVQKSIYIRKANQSITFEPLEAVNLGEVADLQLHAPASSGLSVSFSSSNNAVATITGKTLIIVGPGETTITASQPGNNNFNPAESTSQVFLVNVVASTEGSAIKFQVFPNPVTDVLTVESLSPIHAISLTDVKGISWSANFTDHSLDVRHLPSGIYFLAVISENRQAVIKIFKK